MTFAKLDLQALPQLKSYWICNWFLKKDESSKVRCARDRNVHRVENTSIADSELTKYLNEHSQPCFETVLERETKLSTIADRCSRSLRRLWLDIRLETIHDFANSLQIWYCFLYCWLCCWCQSSSYWENHLILWFATYHWTTLCRIKHVEMFETT